MFRRSRGAARDVVVLQDPVESMSPDQIALVVDPIPVVPSALVQARVDEGDRLPALVHLVEHKLPVPKDVGRRRGPAALSGLAVVVGALGVRLWNVVILWRGSWWCWVSDRRLRRGRRFRIRDVFIFGRGGGQRWV